MLHCGLLTIDWNAWIGVGQIGAILVVGKWALDSARDQIGHLRAANRTTQEHYQASLDQANGQQQIQLAFEILKMYHEETTLFGYRWSPATGSEFVVGLAVRKKIPDIKEVVRKVYVDLSNVPQVEWDAMRQAVSASIIVNNYFMRITTLLARKLVDEGLIMTLGELGAQAFPFVQEVVPPHIKTKAYAAYVTRYRELAENYQANKSKHVSDA